MTQLNHKLKPVQQNMPSSVKDSPLARVQQKKRKIRGLRAGSLSGSAGKKIRQRIITKEKK